MKLSELKRIIDLTLENGKQDPEVMVVIKMPYATVGSHPMVKVKSVSNGFDWEAGKFMIWPEENLQQFDVDFSEKFKDLERTMGVLLWQTRMSHSTKKDEED
jgi:hypothetical protein